MPTNGKPKGPAVADRMPPHNLDIERAAIGCALIDDEARDELLQILAPDDFFRDAHSIVWKVLGEMVADGREINTLTIAEELQRRKLYDRVGGDDTISDIINSVPHGLSWMEFGAIVASDGMARRLIAAADETLRQSYDRSRIAEELVAEAEARIFEVSDRSLRSDVVTGAEAATAARHAIEARRQGLSAGVKTGWKDLDNYTHGFNPGSLTLVGARPSMGKTAFALNLVDRVAVARGQGVLFFSLEMATVELGERLISIVGRVDGSRIKEGTLSDQEVANIDGGVAGISESAIWIEDTPARTVHQIGAVSRRIAAQARRKGVELSLILIDYMQLIEADTDSRRGESREQQVAKMSRELKKLARRLSVPVIVLSQLNRGVENRTDPTPRMSDLRESGALEQDADFVLLLHRPDYYDPASRRGEIDIIVAKNRNGRTGTATMVFKKEMGRFELFSGRREEIHHF